ncbi:hypothetical protein [Kocuria sabuli]|uniref:hypothetical protein n=1 Tax=Kocuria sabuli TaxID=3071448 RepID=UPI0034D3E831
MRIRLDNLTADEQNLARALEEGVVYGPETPENQNAPVIRAEAIRLLLRNVGANLTPDPKGLRLRHIEIEGRINLDHIDTSIPLDFDRCHLPDGLTAAHAKLPILSLRNISIERHSTENAILHLHRLRVDDLILTGCTLINRRGPALTGTNLIVDSNAMLNGGFTVRGEGPDGAVRLLGATINGILHLGGAKLTNFTGPALMAAGNVTVGANAFLFEGFTAHGAGPMGAVCFLGANIKGILHMKDAQLTNETGPALNAEDLTAGPGVFLDGCFAARGAGVQGAVRLTRATIGGQLNLANSYLTNWTGPGLQAEDLTVGSTISVAADNLRRASSIGNWNVTGLTYRGLDVEPYVWLRFLRLATSEYSPQPYQQFATVTHNHGEEHLTREALIAQRNDLLAASKFDHKLLTIGQRLWQRALQATVGYGYKTWRALLWLLVLVGVAAAGTLVSGTGNTTVLQQPLGSKAGVPEGPCRVIDLWMLSLEIIPIVPLVSGITDRCVVTASTEGGAYLAASIFLKLVSWALVTLFVAGYTNIVRNPKA